MSGQIALSYMCNIRHTFCFQTSFSTLKLSDEILYEKLIPLYQMIDHVRILGGEPLIIPGIKKYIGYLIENYPEMKIEIPTNGINLDQWWIDISRESNVVFRVSLNAISMNVAKRIIRGPSAEIHQKKLLENLDTLIKAHNESTKPLLMSISMVVNKDTEEDMEKVVEYALENGINLAMQNPADLNNLRLSQDQENLALKSLKLLYFCDNFIDTIDFHTPEYLRQLFISDLKSGKYEEEKIIFLRNIQEKLSIKKTKTKMSYYNYADEYLKLQDDTLQNNCSMPNNGFSISPNGDFSICNNIHHYVIGNINNSSIPEILDSTRIKNLQAMINNKNYLYCWSRCKFVTNPETCMDLSLTEANIHFFSGHYQKAKPIYEKAVAGDPANGFFWLRLAQCCQAQGENTAAQSYYNRAEACGEESARSSADCLSANMLFDEGKYQEAKILFEKLADEETDQAMTVYRLAYCCHAVHENKAALKYYDHALRLGFSEFWVKYNRGSLYADIGQKAEALADMRRAVELVPSHEGARQVLNSLER
jgi:tetratricopeptide (TPR) repeat protein